MSLTYFKRYRMEFRLGDLPAERALPEGYELVPWHESLLAAHSEAKFGSFYLEMDANVFPCLGTRDGCARLMSEIARRDGFCPSATWLARWREPGSRRVENCGTVQGVRDGAVYGAIQNLGIVSGHRGQGLGGILLYRALQGFAREGLSKAYLEVTAHNTGAVRLYQRFGFRKVKVVYKAAEVAFA